MSIQSGSVQWFASILKIKFRPKSQKLVDIVPLCYANPVSTFNSREEVSVVLVQFLKVLESSAFDGNAEMNAHNQYELGDNNW